MKTTNKQIKTKIYNLVILDKSGSMESIRKEAIDGYNETLGTIRASQRKYADTQEHFVSLAAFCGCGINMIYDKTPIGEVDKLTKAQYEPCCSTPLFDAIGITVKKLKSDIKDAANATVVVTIITDGYENASKEWTADAVRKLVEEHKKEGWVFSFIGAGEDVLRVATEISIKNTLLWEKTSKGTGAMFSKVGKAQKRYYDRVECCMAMAEPCAALEELNENYFEE